MHYSTSTEDDYLIFLLKYTKDLLYEVFTKEIERYAFGSNFRYAAEVYSNDNSAFGSNDSIDFKYIVFALERGFEMTQMGNCDKALFKSLFRESVSLRNILWHSKKISRERIEKIAAIWKKAYQCVKSVYQGLDEDGLLKMTLMKLDEHLMKTGVKGQVERVISPEDIASDGYSSNGNEDCNEEDNESFDENKDEVKKEPEID